MSAEKAPDAAAAPEVAKRRFAPKLIIIAGVTTALLAGVGGAAVWLWPTGPDPAAVAAKVARKEARRAAALAAASAAQAASAVAAEPAESPVAADSAPDDAHSAHNAPPAQEAAPALAAHDPAPPAARADTHAAKAAAEPAAAASLDRLQRRLGEVLGGKGRIDASRPGELHLTARQGGVVPVRHGSPAAADLHAATPASGHAEAAPHKAARAAHWSYSGLGGPQAWGKLKPEFKQCAIGQRQSPIDIRDGIALDLEPVQFDYQPSAFSVIDNGHTVQVNVAPGNSIEVNGKRFALLQFHFHRPSEERVNGRQFEMDAHLVHKDGEGRLAVVAVLLERGAAQPLLQTVWNNLPLEKNEEVAARAQIDLVQLLPTDRRYYTFMGSLTTPPCSEGVLWLVMQQPVTLSAQQLDIFSRLYPMNARPIQQASGRIIKQSN
jgi:carbonic anhydrase